ncbi:MAG: hypothetical protein PHI98_15955 [Eubacteriales bacterium]|nr:hypothetical protein [Eubacteriales bacterium]
MNFYLFFFSLYGVMILPLTLRFRLRLGKKSGYRLRMQAAGLPFVRKRTSDDHRDEQPIQEKEVAQTLASADLALLRAALNRQVLRRIFSMLKCTELELYGRFSFDDASLTALAFCGLTTVLGTLKRIGVLPDVFFWRLEADFKAEGTEILVQGIIRLRLGSLLPATALFARTYLRAKGRRSKEEAYAAASH